MSDRREFEEQAMEHIDALYRGAMRMTGDPDDAQDLVQEVYVRAIRFHHQYQPGTNIRAWLFRILKNTFINQYRKSARTPDQVDIEEPEFHRFEREVAESSPRGQSAEAEFFSRQTAEEIEKALSGLAEPFRRVVVLADVEGFSYKEIAEIEECPLGTVMSRLYRARRLLQKALLGEGGGPA